MGPHSNLVCCRLDVFRDSLCFDSECVFTLIVSPARAHTQPVATAKLAVELNSCIVDCIYSNMVAWMFVRSGI